MREYIHNLFREKQYTQLYKEYTVVINEMLLLETISDFEDFLSQGGTLDEDVFWLYYAALQGKSLLIGGYEKDVTERVKTFLRQQLPESAFNLISNDLQNLYVDLGTRDTLVAHINICNNLLKTTMYLIQVKYVEMYCAGIYFLSVKCNESDKNSSGRVGVLDKSELDSKSGVIE